MCVCVCVYVTLIKTSFANKWSNDTRFGSLSCVLYGDGKEKTICSQYHNQLLLVALEHKEAWIWCFFSVSYYRKRVKNREPMEEAEELQWHEDRQHEPHALQR